MKYLLMLLLLAGCATTKTTEPLLEVGSCYDLEVYSTYDPTDPWSSSSSHELSQFKIVKVFDFEGKKHYAIQVLKTEWSGKYSPDLVPLYSKAKTYGYASVEMFDQYIGVNSGKFSPASKKTIDCNPITDQDREKYKKSPRKPLNRVGSDLDGTGK